MVIRPGFFLGLLGTLVLISKIPAAPYLSQSFTGSTAPDWTFVGNASLTGGSSDVTGFGWLRMTDNKTNQSSFVYNSTDIPFLYGLDVKMSYVAWGGSGADGITLDLINGNINITKPGGYGGSLGYAQNGANTGIPGGIFGIGLDEFGNFSNPTEGRVGGPGSKPNAAVVRGPGDGTSNPTTSTGKPNYGYITGAVSSTALQTGANASLTRPTSSNRYTVEFIIGTQMLAQGQLPITVILTLGTNTSQTVISSYDAYSALLNYYGSPANIPRTANIGFTSGTGGSTNYHELRNLSVSPVVTDPNFEPIPEPTTSSLILATACFGLAYAFAARRRS